MNNIEDFKLFVKKHPNLINYVKNNEMTWQKFYEIYYLYGEDDKIWNSYINTNNTTNKHSLSDLIEMAKNIDVEKVQSGITSLQKALGLVNDLFTKDNNPNNNYRPRPLYRSFDD